MRRIDPARPSRSPAPSRPGDVSRRERAPGPPFHRFIRITLACALLLPGLASSPPVEAEVFHSLDSGLRVAFPTADRVESRPLVLGRAQRLQVENLAGARLESGLIDAWEAFQDGEILGTAYLDTHDVRSLPETVLVVVSPEGLIAGVHLLAFHEPPQYGPPPHWLDRLLGRALDAALWPGRGVDALSGATLSAQAVTGAVRRALAVHAVARG